MIGVVRPYEKSDEPSWLRCRVLGFLDTSYYDDVKRAKTPFDGPAIELVVDDGTDVIALIDIEIMGTTATIDTVAVHPDYRSRGLAAQLLDAALAELRVRGVETLDAWTREDVIANNWYLRSGFTENYRYLHVYDVDGEITPPPPMTSVVTAMMHARIEDEVELRKTHDRVYVCRQYLRQVTPAASFIVPI